MSKFKVGDKVIPKDGEWSCGSAADCHVAYAKITKIDNRGEYWYDLYNEADERVDWCCACLRDSNIKLFEKTLDNLEVGDVLDVLDGDTKTVLAVLPGVVLLSDANQADTADGWWTIAELRRKKWTIKDETPTVTELTLEQVAKLAKIPVDQLRIKDKK